MKNFYLIVFILFLIYFQLLFTIGIAWIMSNKIQFILNCSFSIFLICSLFFITNKKYTKATFLVIILFFIINISFAFYRPMIYSDFSKTNWTNFPGERYAMIDSLELKYGIIGKSESFLLDLLGEPTKKSNRVRFVEQSDAIVYTYYIASSLQDAPTLNIVFKNGVAVDYYESQDL